MRLQEENMTIKINGNTIRNCALVLILALLVVGIGFAQDAGKNTVLVSLGLLHMTASYERDISEEINNLIPFPNYITFSAVADAGYDSFFIFWTDTYFALRGRWYPWEEGFFADLGLGIGTYALQMAGTENKPGFLISPGIGWKIHPGKQPRGFTIQPAAGINVILGRSVTVPFLKCGFGWRF
jgi:hypothetical protein